MNHTSKHLLGLTAILTLMVSFAEAEGFQSGDKVLNVAAKSTKKLEVSSSFGGFRSTLIFYTFKEQKAVLRVLIDNKSKEFPVSAVLYEFADDVSEDALKKWLNNQHSDALFADAPRPAATHKTKAGTGKVKSKKLIDQSTTNFGKFDNYSVTFQVQGVMKIGKFSLKSFTDKATVHLKAK